MKRLWPLFFVALVAASLSQVPQVSQADAVGSGGLYAPVTQKVLVDTSTGVGGSSAAFSAGQSRSYAAGGLNGVPADASAILVNLAAISTTASDNYAMIGPDGTTLPGLSSIRYAPETTPRSITAIVTLGSNGKFKLINKYGSTDFRVTLIGYFTKVGVSGSAPGGYVGVTPTRIADSSVGLGLPLGQINPGVTNTVQVTSGDGPVPSDASAIFGSVTVTSINSDGDVRLWAADQTMPAMSSIDYSLGGPEQNTLMIPLSSTGQIKLANLGANDIHVSVDVQGYFSSDPTKGGGYTSVVRQSVFSSGVGADRLQANEVREFDVSSDTGIPQVTGGVVLTVVAASYGQDGFVELYDASQDESPGLGDVHFNNSDAGREVSATTVVRPSELGTIRVKNTSAGPVEVRVNVQGWFSAPPKPQLPAEQVVAGTGGFSEAQVDQMDTAAQVEEVIATVPDPEGVTAGDLLTIGIEGDDYGNLPTDLTDEIHGVLVDMYDEQQTTGTLAEQNSFSARVSTSVAGIKLIRVALRDNNTLPSQYVSYLADPSEGEDPSGGGDSETLLARASGCSDTWWPNKLAVKTGKSEHEGRRYAQLEFSWSSARLGNLKCHDHVTFEPDFITNNYDGDHYYAEKMTKWASNMPDAYKDTNFADSSDERVYTIGTSRARKLTSEKTYKTYFRTAYGNATWDTEKVNFQRGHRVPSWCDSTWCVFAQATKRVPNSGWDYLPVLKRTYTP